MKKIRTLLHGVALAALASGAASAADLPRRTVAPAAPVYAAPIFTWTGFYVGLNAGANINDSRYAWAPFFNGNGQSGLGFTGGGQLGYNWQMGALVLGLETDINYRSASNNNNGGFGVNSGNARDGYFGTVRGRVGYAFDRMMIYATGGLAYGNSNFPTRVVGLDAFGTPRAFFGQNNDSTRLGWTLGGGVEYALTNNWSIKGEYLYVDLGRSAVGYIDAFSGAPMLASARNRDHVVRAGVNYKF